jgi:hypothetical protein
VTLRLRNHLRDNLVAYVALFFAIGGVSYAAVDLVKDSIGPRQIKQDAVRAPEVKRAAVRSSEVKDDALGGADIDEATLGQVPSADRIDGLDSSEFQRSRPRTFQTSVTEVQNFIAGSTLAELTVSQGTYLALAKLSIIHPGAGNDATTTCDLSVPGGTGDSQRSRMGGGGAVADQLGFPLATTFTGAGQMSIACTNFSGANDAFNIKLIAIRLD